MSMVSGTTYTKHMGVFIQRALCKDYVSSNIRGRADIVQLHWESAQ
jgi:hypothetical protein